MSTNIDSIDVSIKPDIVMPDAESILQSSRSYGYDFSTAIADIIDNSISARANNIWLLNDFQGLESAVALMDDGEGMSEEGLIDALRLGSKNPLDQRSRTDLGRFGLGLKTASFSQCKRLTVRSKTKAGDDHTKCWDLDYVKQTKGWTLIPGSYDSTKTYLKILDGFSEGTIVVWEKLDRMIDAEQEEDSELLLQSFYAKMQKTREYLGMVFHNHLTGFQKKRIYINNIDNWQDKSSIVVAWDPFLTTHPSIQKQPVETISYRDSKITITPYIVPHKSKYTSEKGFQEAGGPFGWNAHQGFYVYRQNRLILFGSWLGLGYKKEDHYKLARIRIDIDNSIDQDWKIDVRKSEAVPPDKLRRDIKKIAKRTRDLASGIYRARGKTTKRELPKLNAFIWKRKKIRGKYSFAIDRKNDLVRHYMSLMKPQLKLLKEFLWLIEKSVPVEHIVITNSETPDSHELELDLNSIKDIPVRELLKYQYKINRDRGHNHAEAWRLTISTEPFSSIPELYGMEDMIDG